MSIIFQIFLVLIIFVLPVQAEISDSSSRIELYPEIESQEELEVTERNHAKIMSEAELIDLLGPDPYLGPTDWLNSKSKK